MAQTRVLLADDEDTLRQNLAKVLTEEGFDVIACKDGAEALQALKRQPIDAMITDLRMPGVTGMDLIGLAAKLAPDAIVIVITAFGEVETAVEAMKKGVQDYLCKPLILDEVIFRLKRLLAHDSLNRENRILREQLLQTTGTVQMVGESPAIRSIRQTIDRIAHTTSNVLISGESGTGKEVIARVLHQRSVTRDRPFVAVNCGGLSEQLIESELFGHRRGAFTGATTDHVGYFEAAAGGTLFLDEIGNLPLSAQAVLLRAIEQKAVIRVGETRPRPVSFRMVAATNRALEQAVEAGEFREDLFFRLNVIRLNVPPLRERPEDIPALVDHFVAKYRAEMQCHCPGFDDEALEAMYRWPWRGNVRELENVVERAVIFAGDQRVGLQDLSIPGAQETSARSTSVLDLREATRDFERRHIGKVLSLMKYNKSATAETLGIGLSSLYRKLDELDIAKQADE